MLRRQLHTYRSRLATLDTSDPQAWVRIEAWVEEVRPFLQRHLPSESGEFEHHHRSAAAVAEQRRRAECAQQRLLEYLDNLVLGLELCPPEAALKDLPPRPHHEVLPAEASPAPPAESLAEATQMLRCLPPVVWGVVVVVAVLVGLGLFLAGYWLGVGQ